MSKVLSKSHELSVSKFNSVRPCYLEFEYVLSIVSVLPPISDSPHPTWRMSLVFLTKVLDFAFGN